jgi:hypothetical protein
MLSGAILGALIGLWHGGLLILLCPATGQLEMSKPAYRELATNFTLWCKFVLLEEQVSEREFNEMSIDEKLDILQGCFDHEIRAFPPPSTAAVTPRLRSG